MDVMREKRETRKRSITFRVYVALVVFLVFFMVQISFKTIRDYYVLEPQNKMMAQIQNLSSFISIHSESVNAYSSFRWDYGDKEEFINEERKRNREAGILLSSLPPADISSDREEYLLGRAAENLFETYQEKSEEVMVLLEKEEREEASVLYYRDLSYCSQFLGSTIEDLLEAVILRTKVSFDNLSEVSKRIDNFQSLFTLLSLLCAVILIVDIAKLLSGVTTLSRMSKQMGNGIWDIPDIEVKGNDEIADLSIAFNTMKHATESQMKLLEEKNLIQEELFSKEKESLALKNLLEEERLQQLRSRINPHFLFNTLNVIKFSANEEKAEKTESMLESLSLLYRYALGSNSDSVPVSRELRIVVALSSLYRARFRDKVSLKWESQLDYDLSEVMVPSFILQPIVENAYRHGIVPKKDHGEVEIQLSSFDSNLKITISDNGVGMDEDTLERVRTRIKEKKLGEEHIGIGNVAARVLMLSPSSRFSVESKKGEGTRVVMIMPLVIVKEDE